MVIKDTKYNLQLTFYTFNEISLDINITGV
jgi:hypothetical protein